MCAKNLKLVRILDCGDPRARTIERGLELLAISRPASTSAFCPGQRAGCSTRAGRAEISQAGNGLWWYRHKGKPCTAHTGMHPQVPEAAVR